MTGGPVAVRGGAFSGFRDERGRVPHCNNRR
jgi:hypothetical protein